jgi:hypothetical protein
MQNTSPLELYNPRPLPLSSCSQTDNDHVPETNNNTAHGRSTHGPRHLAQSLSRNPETIQLIKSSQGLVPT